MAFEGPTRAVRQPLVRARRTIDNLRLTAACPVIVEDLNVDFCEVKNPVVRALALFFVV